MRNYTPVYWTVTYTLPAPTGVFGSSMNRNIMKEDQRAEAISFLTFLKTNPKGASTLTLTTKPIPLLVKVPGTCKVKFLLGLAPCFSNLFATQQSEMHGELLAINDDIDDVLESPVVRKLPATLLDVREVICPSSATFQAEMGVNAQNGTGTEWFKAQDLSGTAKEPQALAMVALFPLYLAYDALTGEVDTQVVYDCIEVSALDQEAPDLATYVSCFLQAVHTKQTGANPTVDMGTAPFLERQHPDAKKWAQDRAKKLFAHSLRAGLASGQLPNQSDLSLLAQAFVDDQGHQALVPSIIPHQNMPPQLVSPVQDPSPPQQPKGGIPAPQSPVLEQANSKLQCVTTLHRMLKQIAQHKMRSKQESRIYLMLENDSRQPVSCQSQKFICTAAHKLLESYAKQGCPVDCGPNWTWAQLEAALKYGAHPSARTGEALECLVQEAQEKEKEGFVKIITWGSIKDTIPKKLKLSPIAMIPYKSRKF